MRTLRIVFSFVIGLAIGIVFHYALYRMGLPIQPFIYLAF
jgi:xanthosine utilization system XapX-like protein